MSAGWICATALGMVRAFGGLETFDATGLGTVNWTASGSFTGQQGIVWTFAQARASSVVAGNPGISLRSQSAAEKGWLKTPSMTGGAVRVSAALRQVLTSSADCDVWVGNLKVGNYVSSGNTTTVDVVSFDVVDPATRLPPTNEVVLTISNRLATSGTVAIDDLAWEPFRIFARLDRMGTNTAWAGAEFDAEAEVFQLGQAWVGGWEIPPAFEGEFSNTNESHLTLIPAAADIGKRFSFSYLATELEGTGAAHRAGFDVDVLEAPNARFVDFEGALFNYNTNAGTNVYLNGMNWRFFNVMSGSTTNDSRLGSTSARFRHSSSTLAASMESLEPFGGIGTISLHFAYFGSNRVVNFLAQVRPIDEEAWTTIPDGAFSAEGHGDISNHVFSVDVQRSDELYFRLVTTGNAGEIANVDDIRIRPYGETLPRLAWTGSTNVPVGWETVVDFTLLNRDGVGREWEFSLEPTNAYATFEPTAADQLRLRFAPSSVADWGTYLATATVRIEDEWMGTTSVALRVVSPPAFSLVALPAQVVVTNLVDVRATNVALHAGGTNWTTAWIVQPPFANVHSVSNKSQYRIGSGTTAADVGPHMVSAVVTDLGTGVKATNAVVVTVASGGGGALTNEVYPILSFTPTNLVVSGKVGRVYLPFGTTNLSGGAAEDKWIWRGNAVTNVDGADVRLDVPGAPHPVSFYYGVKVREAP